MKKRFTLIELLVVIAAIAMLTAMLFPSLTGSRARARLDSCISNKKQAALAQAMYASDYCGFQLIADRKDMWSKILSGHKKELIKYAYGDWSSFVCPSVTTDSQRWREGRRHPQCRHDRQYSGIAMIADMGDDDCIKRTGRFLLSGRGSVRDAHLDDTWYFANWGVMMIPSDTVALFDVLRPGKCNHGWGKGYRDDEALAATVHGDRFFGRKCAAAYFDGHAAAMTENELKNSANAFIKYVPALGGRATDL